MTTRERALAVLRGDKPDKLPWYADLAYWIDYLNDEKLMPEKYLRDPSINQQADFNQGLAAPFNGSGLHQLHKDLNVGFYLQGYFPFSTHYDGVKIINDITHNERGTLRVTTIKTPVGDMQEVWEYINSTYSWGPKVHMVKGVEDLKKIRYVYEHSHYEPDYALAQERVQMVGDEGLVLCYMPKSPIMEMIALRAGIEQVVYLVMDDEDEWNETMSVMEKSCDKACEIVLNSPAECIMIPDNLSSGSIGRTFYNQYAKPYHKKWCDRIREKKKFSLVHLDGTINPLITELCEAGFDVIEALTPFPVGDVKFKDIRALTNGKAILWGGIPGGLFHPSVSDKDFDAYVIDLIQNMKKDGSCVLAVGDQVVPGTTFERIARVARLVDQYGVY
jgi:hypothetical protein